LTPKQYNYEIDKSSKEDARQFVKAWADRITKRKEHYGWIRQGMHEQDEGTQKLSQDLTAKYEEYWTFKAKLNSLNIELDHTKDQLEKLEQEIFEREQRKRVITTLASDKRKLKKAEKSEGL
jgi:phosphopantothenoylcysteine synthetase/decarboxylase